MNKILRQDFFKSRKTMAIARKLLGKFLVRRYRGKEIVCMITEVEAYDGFEDKASHAHRGKTERNKIMFGEAGYWYVYFTYGMHWMLNVVTGPREYPAAVLIRGIEFSGQRINGPARLTKFLKIEKNFNGEPAIRQLAEKPGLWIEDRGVKIRSKEIKSALRVGVNYAGKIWASKKYRFFMIY